MIVAWQLVRGKTEKISEFQVGSEHTTSIMPVRCSDHWATGTPGDLGSHVSECKQQGKEGVEGVMVWKSTHFAYLLLTEVRGVYRKYLAGICF